MLSSCHRDCCSHLDHQCSNHFLLLMLLRLFSPVDSPCYSCCRHVIAIVAITLIIFVAITFRRPASAAVLKGSRGTASKPYREPSCRTPASAIDLQHSLCHLRRIHDVDILAGSKVLADLGYVVRPSTLKRWWQSPWPSLLAPFLATHVVTIVVTS